jgi:hydrogenase expression/formation protein HypC
LNCAPTTTPWSILAGVKEISLALVDGVAVGDYVIVHVGYALNKLDPEEAEKTLKLFAEMGEGLRRRHPTIH